MQFYDVFADLCIENDVSINKACDGIGIAHGTPSQWKQRGSIPNELTVRRVAKYFGVTPQYITAKLNGEEPVAESSTEDYLELLRTRPEMRMLFNSAKNASKEQIEAVARMIEGFANAN